MRLIPAAAAAAALAMVWAASAHPLPKAASPAPNAALAASPTEIRVTFSEALIAAFSGLELRSPSGAVIPTGPATVDRVDNKRLASPVKVRLGPGTYTVYWRAVGDDTHHVAGHYSFKVK